MRYFKHPTTLWSSPLKWTLKVQNTAKHEYNQTNKNKQLWINSFLVQTKLEIKLNLNIYTSGKRLCCVSVCDNNSLLCVIYKVILIPLTLIVSLVQIPPDSTLHFLGPLTTHRSSVKLIKWTVLEIRESHTNRFMESWDRSYFQTLRCGCVGVYICIFRFVLF